MPVDFASVFRVLTSLFGWSALVAVGLGVVAIVVDGPWDLLLLLGFVTAFLSLVFRIMARAAGGPSKDRVSLAASWVIVVVVGSLIAFVALFIWAIGNGFE